MSTDTAGCVHEMLPGTCGICMGLPAVRIDEPGGPAGIRLGRLPVAREVTFRSDTTCDMCGTTIRAGHPATRIDGACCCDRCTTEGEIT